MEINMALTPRAESVVRLTLILLSLPLLSQEQLRDRAQSSVDEALLGLRGQASDQARAARFFQRGGTSDGRIVPALRTAFDAAADRVAKQEIAVSLLLRHADDSQPVFDYLASLAWAAVKSDAPFAFLRDPITNIAIRGQLDPNFMDWCKKNNKDWQAEVSNQLYTYYWDILTLRSAHDLRSTPIFRAGLASNIGTVRAQCIAGLGDFGNVADLGGSVESAIDGDPGMPDLFARALAVWVRKGYAVQVERALTRGPLLERVKNIVRSETESQK